MRTMAARRPPPSVGLKRRGNAVTVAGIPDERAQQDPAAACIADECQALDNAGFAEKVRAAAEGYGPSECTVVCTLNPLHGVRKAGSVGLPMPGTDVGVVDEAGRLLPAGQPGEVVVRGPNVMRGYLRRPEESGLVLRGGWLHTGDVGRFDDDGYLTLVT